MRLSDLMEHARNCKSSDPRDMIYAFLGLMDRPCPILPDYDVSMNTVRTQAAKYLMQKEQGMDILARARGNKCLTTTNDPLPSWAPDWFGTIDDNPEHDAFMAQIHPERQQYQAGGDDLPDVVFDNDRYGNTDRVLEATCLYVDTLGSVFHDSYGVSKIFEGRNNGEDIQIEVQSNAQSGDEVWVIVGAKEPYLLRRHNQGATILGFAMLRVLDGTSWQMSPIMRGSLYDLYKVGDNNIVCERIRII